MPRTRRNPAADRLAAALAEAGLADGWDVDGRSPSELGPGSALVSRSVAEPGPRSGAGPGTRSVPGAGSGAERGGGESGRPSPRHADPVDGPRWLSLPAGLGSARVAATRPAVVAVVLIAVVFAAVFGVRLLRARDVGSVVAPAAAQLTANSPTATGASGPGQSGASVVVSATPGSAPAAAPGGAGAGTIIVHVVGQVRHAGVVELPPGSRVVDAIDKAGGAGRKADLSAVNLARLLVDGEQIVVPKPGEAPAAAPTSAAGNGGGPAAPAGAGSAKVNLNTADLAAFDSLPGVGPVLAGRILAWRTEHGRFTSIDELAEVSGIGEKVLANLTPLVTL